MSITVTPQEVEAFKLGSSCVKLGGSHNVIVHKAADGSLKIAPNACQHMTSTFVPDVEDAGIMKCTFHNWKLDPSTMTYVKGSNPNVGGFVLQTMPEGTKQPEFSIEKKDDGSLVLTPPAGSGGSTCEVC